MIVPPSTYKARELRTIHYLGSKLRLLEPIRKAIESVVTPGTRVCDLFAGSGTVSLFLGTAWNITSVDIQEYSRVICNGLQNPPAKPMPLGYELYHAASTSQLRKHLSYSLEDLIYRERACLNHAICGDITGLCDLVESGSLIKARTEDVCLDGKIEAIVQKCWERLCSERAYIGQESVVTRYFGNVYFSWQQAIAFDALLNSIHRLDSSIRDFYLAAALAVASDTVNTVGKQFAQPIKLRNATGQPKNHLVKQVIRDRSINVLNTFIKRLLQFSALPKSNRKHQAIRADYRAVLADRGLEFNAVFADPPYTRDHYSRYYHVLETMSLHDEPNISTTTIRSAGKPKLSRGHYRSDRHQSPFCIKSQTCGAFEKLFDGVSKRGVPLIISYSPYQKATGNRPRLLTIDELRSIASRYFRKIDVQPVAGVSHNKFNSSAVNVVVDNYAEILIVCSQ